MRTSPNFFGFCVPARYKSPELLARPNKKTSPPSLEALPQTVTPKNSRKPGDLNNRRMERRTFNQNPLKGCWIPLEEALDL